MTAQSVYARIHRNVYRTTGVCDVKDPDSPRHPSAGGGRLLVIEDSYCLTQHEVSPPRSSTPTISFCMDEVIVYNPLKHFVGLVTESSWGTQVKHAIAREGSLNCQ